MERIVPSNLPDPPCGTLRYYANEGDPAQLVLVTYVFGEQIATFLDVEEEDGEATYLVDQMDGTFERIREGETL
jgi:hypothetical protein